MSIVVGTQLGSYEITALLGKGGMGEVYRARDSKLKREVAIKILPDQFSDDPERVSRFQREAESLAALNHQNIAAIHDLQETDGRRFLVLELVEGETLAERILRDPIPLDEALSIACSICEALEAAHDKGVIHRDLKPSNVKITPDGKVKVLDFGLAKAIEATSASRILSHSPTLSLLATNEGLVMGTAAYMSPEQAKGRKLDRRTDIFAFGCVLYEMLTQRQVFEGEDIPEILSRVLQREPDWTLLPPHVPARIRELLRLCLQKDIRKRRSDAADVRLDIEQALSFPTDATDPSRQGSTGRERLAWTLAAVFLIAMAALAVPAVRYYREGAVEALPEIRTEIATPTSTDPLSFALSPDGRQLVFVASGDGSSRLWLRPLSATSSQPLPGTESAIYPFWSPDSRSIGFFAEGKLKRLDLGGSSPQTITDATTARGAAWSSNGVIVFGRNTGGPLFRVSASGGEAVAITKLDRQSSHRFPKFLPDGQQFLFFAVGPPETSGIYLGSLASGETKRLTAAETSGVYMRAGWMLWVRGVTLVAQHLDLERKELTGDRVTVAEHVGFDITRNFGGFSASVDGLVAYRPGGANRRQLQWFDRTGKALNALGTPDEGGLSNPGISRDGRVSVFRVVQGNSDIWIMDPARTSRFTFDSALDRFPVWSPDGSQIIFESNRSGVRNLYIKPSSSDHSEELRLESALEKSPTDWSEDGRFLMYQSKDPQTDWDLWVLPLEGDGKPWTFLKTNFGDRNGQFSPDGRWVAYMSNESGEVEIYVRPFVVPAAAAGATNRASGQWQVSSKGGMSPRWRADGKELYYIAPDGKLMAVPIRASATTMESGTPIPLYPTRIYGGGADNGQGRQYDVSRDGLRFLINTVLDDASAPITFIQNWKPNP